MVLAAPRRLWLTALVLLGMSCTPKIPDGVFQCSTDEQCPPHQLCGSDGLCRHHPVRGADVDGGDGSVPGIDAQTDAARDAHAPSVVDASELALPDAAGALTLTSVLPADGMLQSPGATITFFFSAAVDPDTVNKDSIEFSTKTGGVHGDFTVDGAHVVFTPTQPWKLADSVAVMLDNTVTDTQGHALVPSQQTFTMRDGAWTTKMAGTSTDPSAKWLHLAVSPQGEAAIASQSSGPSTGTLFTVFATRLLADRTWTDPFAVCRLEDFVDNSEPSHVAVDDFGDVVIACGETSAQPDGITATSWTMGPDWIETALPSTDPDVRDPLLLMDAAGHAFSLMKAYGAGTGAPAAIAFSPGGAAPSNETLPAFGGATVSDAALLGDNVIVVLTAPQPSGHVPQALVMSATLKLDGTCTNGQAACMQQIGTCDSSTRPTVRVAADPIAQWAVAVWDDGGDIDSAVYMPGTLWDPPFPAYQGNALADVPHVAMDSLGTAHVAFRSMQNADVTNTMTVASLSKGDTTWSGAKHIGLAGRTSEPSIAAEPGGYAVATWLESTDANTSSGGDIAVARYLPSTGTWLRDSASALDHTVTPPAAGIDTFGRVLIAWLNGGALRVGHFE